MSDLDPHRVVAAAREFIAVLKRHSRQYNAPGNDTVWGATEVIIAAQKLQLALDGRSMWDPAKPGDDAPVNVFFGVEAIEAARQCGIIRECLRRSLRRTGYRGAQRIEDGPFKDASYGTLPSMEGLEDLPQVGLPELEPLIDATDELEELAKRIALPPGQPTGPADPPPIDFPALVNSLLQQGKSTQAALVRFMADRETATGEEIGESVHGNSEASDKAIGKNARETSDSLVGLDSRLSFRFISGTMFRQVSAK